MAKKTSSKKQAGKKPSVKKTASKKPAQKKASKPERGLGRGLSALMADVNMDAIVSEDVVVPVDSSDPTASVIMDDIVESPDPMEDSVVGTINSGSPSQGEIDAMSAKEYKDFALNRRNMTTEEIDAAFEVWSAKMEAEGNPGENRTGNAPSSDHRAKSGITFVSIGQLERNPEQPRRYFDDIMIKELAESIRQKGVLQPILVRPIPGKTVRNKPAYQVIAGERRWQAAQYAELDTLPVFIREITDQEALEIGVIENVQREALNPVEEAMAYRALIDQFSRTQEEVAKAVGKSRPYVANMLRLLNLPEDVREYLALGQISTGHARAIIAAPDPLELTREIVKYDMSVRDAEDWVRRLKQDHDASSKVVKTRPQKGADERRLEAQLMDILGLAVDLRHKGVSGGELRIKYKTIDQLDDVISRIVGERPER